MKLKMAGVVVTVTSMLVLAACGSNNNDGSGSGDGSLKGKTISYVGFGGLMDETIKSSWMDPFTTDEGAKFLLDSPTDYSKLQVQVESKNVSIDVVDADLFFVNPQCGKLFEHITGLDQSAVLPQFKAESDCGVPSYVYGIGMFYDKGAFPSGGPQNCTDFFDTKKFPGKRSIWSYVGAAGALECAAIAEGADPANPYPIDIDKAIAKLKTIKSSLQVFDSGSQITDSMVNGDTQIVMATMRNYIDATEKGANIDFARGFAGRGVGSFAIPKGAPNKGAAIAWVKTITNPAVNNRILERATGVYSAIGTKPPADWPEQAKAVDVVSGELGKIAWTIDPAWWAANYDAVSEAYGKLLAG